MSGATKGSNSYVDRIHIPQIGGTQHLHAH